jgi:hypothetical protein
MRGVIPAQGKDFQPGVVIGMINGQAPGGVCRPSRPLPDRTRMGPRNAAARSPTPAARRHRGDHDGALTPSSALCCES